MKPVSFFLKSYQIALKVLLNDWKSFEIHFGINFAAVAPKFAIS